MQSLPTNELRALFDLYDINHNGKISWKEYICTVVLIMHGSLEEKLTLLFNVFDEDRNGRISRKEFASAVHKFAKEESEDFINKAFAECDTNHDDTITKEEFYHFIESDKETFKRVCGILSAGLVEK
jgi:Ca2+-binding EF-hand superfamily protein